MSRRGPVTGFPERTTLPSDGDSRPDMILSRVDFPQPLEPMIRPEGPFGQPEIDFLERVDVAPPIGLAHTTQFVDHGRPERPAGNGD